MQRNGIYTIISQKSRFFRGDMKAAIRNIHCGDRSPSMFLEAVGCFAGEELSEFFTGQENGNIL